MTSSRIPPVALKPSVAIKLLEASILTGKEIVLRDIDIEGLERSPAFSERYEYLQSLNNPDNAQYRNEFIDHVNKHPEWKLGISAPPPQPDLNFIARGPD